MIHKHPGKILEEDFLKRLGITKSKLAIEMRVVHSRITDIISGKRSLSIDTALRLGKVFGTAPELWLDLQTYHDVERARNDVELSREIDKIIEIGSKKQARDCGKDN